MKIENAINIMGMVEVAVISNSVHKLSFSLDDLLTANELCMVHRCRCFSRERIYELYIIMNYPSIDITRELSNTNILCNN